MGTNYKLLHTIDTIILILGGPVRDLSTCIHPFTAMNGNPVFVHLMTLPLPSIEAMCLQAGSVC